MVAEQDPQDYRHKRVALVGASGGIGRALLHQLQGRGDIAHVHATRFQAPVDRAPTDRAPSDRAPTDLAPSDRASVMAGDNVTAVVHWSALDATDETAVSRWLADVGPLDWLINCVGYLHDERGRPEKSVQRFDPDHFQRSMMLNCLPSLLLGKYALKNLKMSQQAVFATISARVGSIEDNRLGGWYSYRASKAALNMSLKCLAIEWARSAPGIRVAALHPGTTDTRLSNPFQDNVPAGQLFAAEKTASLLLTQIEQLHTQSTGRFIAYDGEEIPW